MRCYTRQTSLTPQGRSFDLNDLKEKIGIESA